MVTAPVPVPVILPNRSVPPAGVLSVTLLLPFRVSEPLKTVRPLVSVPKVAGRQWH